MNSPMDLVSQSLAEMRREFDSTFAAPPADLREDRESLITIRLAGEALAVRTAHVTGLAKLKRIVPVPSRMPALLGITAVRGALFPAYDLASLLGFPATGSEHSWILFANRETPVGLAFDEFEGQVEVDRTGLCQSDSSNSREHLRQVAKIGAGHRAVVDLPGLVEKIRKSAGLIEQEKG